MSTSVYRLEATPGEPVELGDIRYTLQTDGGDIFRASSQIEAASTELGWLNKGVCVSVGGRRASGAVYETYLVK